MDNANNMSRPVDVNTSNDEGDMDSDIDELSLVTKLFAQQNLHDVPSDILNQVSSNDREKSLHDVHGVLQPTEETPELLREKLNELSLYLSDQTTEITAGTDATNNVSYVFKDIFEKVQHESPEFTERCLLSCLRADAFDVENAADRFILHVQAKVRLYGVDSVGKKLGLKYLGASERQVLEEGAIQVCRKRDRSGRAIVAHFSGLGRVHPVGTLVRTQKLEV